MWNLIDRIGYWIATKWTPTWQLRTGVALTLGGLTLTPTSSSRGAAGHLLDIRCEAGARQALRRRDGGPGSAFRSPQGS